MRSRVFASLFALSMACPAAWAQNLVLDADTTIMPLDDFLQGKPGALPSMSLGSGSRPRGSGVFHGNYCGVGDNGPGLPPVDALDAACMHHDSCTAAGRFPSCACNARFAHETRAVINSPRQPDDLRALAGLVAASIPMIPCR